MASLTGAAVADMTENASANRDVVPRKRFFI